MSFWKRLFGAGASSRAGVASPFWKVAAVSGSGPPASPSTPTCDQGHNWLVNPEQCHWCGKRRKISADEKLAFAIKENNSAEAAVLLNAGTKLPSNCIALALGHFPEDKRLPIVNVLVDAGADIDERDKANNGWTPLMRAAYGKCPKIVKFLIEKGANTRLTDTEGRTVFGLLSIANPFVRFW